MRPSLAARTGKVYAIVGFALVLTAPAGAQLPDADPTARAPQVAERIRTLQQEAERLASRSRTLVEELRVLEVERDLRAQQAEAADIGVASAEQALEGATERLAEIDQRRLDQLPDVETQLVDIYKRGRGGYVRLLLSARSPREFARGRRTVAALTTINERRLAELRRTLEARQQEQQTLEATIRDLQARQADARQAHGSAGRAVTAHAGLVAQIRAQRELNAQYVTELQEVYDRLQREVTFDPGGAAGVPVPLRPFRGALAWPVAGRVTAGFGQTAGRLGGTAVRNGIEVAASEGAAVRAVHAGTVAFADVFTGFGNLVIVNHGGNHYSLYGYLGSARVQPGEPVAAGAELGAVGFAPAGPPALYFELRIDGQSVDPVQWLEPR